MDIKFERDSMEGGNYFESYSKSQLDKYFSSFPFIETAQVYFRGAKHDTKKVKIKMRLKGKDIFAEGSGTNYELAHDSAVDKLYNQITKYKSKRYKNAS